MLAVFAVDIATGKDAEPLPALLTTSDAVTNAAAKVLESGEFKVALGESLLLHAPSGLKAERLLIVGLGKAKTLSVDEIRKGAGAAVRAAKSRGIREMAIAFPEDHALSDEHLDELPCPLTARALVEGAELAEVDYDTYRSDRKDRSLQVLTVIAKESEKTTTAEIQTGFDEGLIVAAAQNFTRSLVNEPGNVLTPTELGKRAAAMCAEAGLKCEVYSTEKLHELKMGAFWAVSQGSAEPPALIVMTYEPKLAKGQTLAADAPVLGLVGKGITFDTGGISIKPADGMEKMKYDMAGAAAMIGAMQAIAQVEAEGEGNWRGLLGREYAGWKVLQAGRCGDGDVGQDDRGRQYGCGGAAGPGRRSALRQDAGLHASDQRGDVDRSVRGCAGNAECWECSRTMRQRGRSSRRRRLPPARSSGGCPAPMTTRTRSRARLRT